MNNYVAERLQAEQEEHPKAIRLGPAWTEHAVMRIEVMDADHVALGYLKEKFLDAVGYLQMREIKSIQCFTTNMVPKVEGYKDKKP